MSRSYIDQEYSFYNEFISLSLSLSLSLRSPLSVGIISLYSPSPYISTFHLYNFLGKHLDACPIKTLLEVIKGAMSCENTIQMSFLHKRGQFSLCNALNMEMAVTFLDISSFCCLHGSVIFPEALLYGVVDYLKYSRGGFPPRTSYLCAYGSLFILGSLIILGQGLKPLGMLESLTPTIVVLFILVQIINYIRHQFD